MIITSYCSTFSTSPVLAAALCGCACAIPCLLQVPPRFRGHARAGAAPSPLCHASLSSDTPARGGHARSASPPRTVAAGVGDRLQPGLHTHAPHHTYVMPPCGGPCESLLREARHHTV